MIDALIGGTLHNAAVKRRSANGKPFFTGKVRAAMGDGESIFFNVIAFSETVGNVLLALDAGESVSLAGALTPEVWVPTSGDPRPVLDLLVHAATAAYHVTRNRQAVGKLPEALAKEWKS